MIFCGAPGHLMGRVGIVKMALPPLKFLIRSNVFVTYFWEKFEAIPDVGSSRASGNPSI